MQTALLLPRLLLIVCKKKKQKQNITEKFVCEMKRCRVFGFCFCCFIIVVVVVLGENFSKTKCDAVNNENYSNNAK